MSGSLSARIVQVHGAYQACIVLDTQTSLITFFNNLHNNKQFYLFKFDLSHKILQLLRHDGCHYSSQEAGSCLLSQEVNWSWSATSCHLYIEETAWGGDGGSRTTLLSKPRQLEHKEFCKEAKVTASVQPLPSAANWGPLPTASASCLQTQMVLCHSDLRVVT